LILQVEDYNSAALTSGYPGITLYTKATVADAKVSLWAGGNANVMPAYVNEPFFVFGR
jgi:hypothetical protein